MVYWHGAWSVADGSAREILVALIQAMVVYECVVDGADCGQIARAASGHTVMRGLR